MVAALLHPRVAAVPAKAHQANAAFDAQAGLFESLDSLVHRHAGADGIVDEDYGLVTLEAFLAAKPVVTASDSGGTLEFVTDGVNGAVVEPVPEALGLAVRRLHERRAEAAAFGAAGRERAAAITWDGVIERLVAHG